MFGQSIAVQQALCRMGSGLPVLRMYCAQFLAFGTFGWREGKRSFPPIEIQDLYSESGSYARTMTQL